LKTSARKLASNKAWRIAHREQFLACKKASYIFHREQRIASTKAWNFAHREQHLASSKHWKDLHQERVREYDSKKVLVRKFLIPQTHTILNQWFEGSEYHHLGNGWCVWIPKPLHRSIPHSLTKNRNMVAINQASFQWLIEKEMEKFGNSQ